MLLETLEKEVAEIIGRAKLQRARHAAESRGETIASEKNYIVL